MSNEELVQAIQAGERDLIPELWQQVERFVRQQANRRISQLNGQCGVEFDDLYQSGFLALVKAVDSYKPENEASFIGWLAFYLKNAFSEASGYCIRKKNALNLAVSLDTPIGEDDDFTLLDTISDPTDRIEEVEERIYQTQLRETLEAALDELPAEYSEIIRKRDLEGQTFRELAAAYGVSHQSIRQRRDNGLRKLRRIKRTSAVGKRLYSFVEMRTPYYRHIGVNRFQTTHTSSVEKAVFYRDWLEQQLLRGLTPEEQESYRNISEKRNGQI